MQLAHKAAKTPRKTDDARILARYWTRSAIAVLSSLMHSAPDPRLRKECAQILLDRGHGRPAQSIMLLNASDAEPRTIDAVVELFGLGTSNTAPTIEDQAVIEAPNRVERALFAAGAWLKSKA